MKISEHVDDDTSNNLANVGDDRFNPLDTGLLFYILGPCLYHIHEIFRIWTQEATGYTVSRLSRLFHTLQTMRGGGLHSRSASCLFLFSLLK